MTSKHVIERACALVAITALAASAAAQTRVSVGPGGTGKSGTAAKAAKRGAHESENLPGGSGLAAIRLAADANKYLFVFIYDRLDEQTLAMRKVFDEATGEVADKADAVAVRRSDPIQRGIVRKLDVARAPVPLALALAPNGAVTGGFPIKFSVQQLMDAFVSPCTEQCLKAIQADKLVFLCVQNKTTKLNDEAMKGVRAFKADPRYKARTEIIMLDPADASEAKALGRLGIDPKTPEAVTVFLTPPGQVIAQISGATDKKVLLAASAKSCGPGCASTGCGSKKKTIPKKK